MYTELSELKDYITNKTGITTYIGVSPESLDTYIRIIPDNFIFQSMNSKVVSANYAVTIQITVDKNNTIKGYEILENLVKYINDNDWKSGGKLLPDGEVEYTDNSFLIKVVYSLKTIIQN